MNARPCLSGTVFPIVVVFPSRSMNHAFRTIRIFTTHGASASRKPFTGAFIDVAVISASSRSPAWTSSCVWHSGNWLIAKTCAISRFVCAHIAVSSTTWGCTPSRPQVLMAIVRKRLDISNDLYTIPQALSPTLFGKILLTQLTELRE